MYGSVDIVGHGSTTFVQVACRTRDVNTGSLHLLSELTVSGSLGVVTAEVRESHPMELSRVLSDAISLVEVCSFRLEVTGKPESRRELILISLE